MTAISLKVNVRELDGLAGGLDRVTGRSLGKAALDAVNEVTVDFEAKAIKGETANINLTEAYVRGKTDLTLASNLAKPRAEILTRGDLTVLGRFPGTVWFRQPGAPRRAGPVKGRRSAGVYVNIRNDDRLQEPQWFAMKLLNQFGLLGVFVRSSKIPGKNDYGKGLGDKGRRRDGRFGKRHIYGPSPYSLFAKQIDLGRVQLEEDLEATALRNLTGEIEKALS